MKKDLALLTGFIQNQENILDKMVEELRAKSPSTKEETVYAGYLLHNLYSGFEELFQEIARTFENRVEDTSRFHRELLKRMSIEVPGIRPKLLSPESFKILDELRAFRHIFRHSYDFELSPAKVSELKNRLLTNWDTIKKDLGDFKGFIAR